MTYSVPRRGSTEFGVDKRGGRLSPRLTDLYAGITISLLEYYRENSMKTVSLKLPDRLDAKLTLLARRRRVTKSAVVRDALEKANNEDVEPQETSCFDLAHDLAGLLDAPRDLSANKRHLQRYGK